MVFRLYRPAALRVGWPAMDAAATDETLMLNYQAGDTAAFELLYARHKGGLYRYLLRQCGNPDTADELFQDIWLGLVRSKDRYEVKAKFTTWIYRMAHNRLIDFYRKNRPAALVSYETTEAEPLGVLSGPEGLLPENEFELRQLAKRLLLALKELPEAQREAFLLCEEAGLDLQQSAQISGVPVETAKSRLRYAVRKLRAALNEQ